LEDEMVGETRSQSFGSIAPAYERYRAGPPVELVEWMLPDHVSTVVDLGAGTGAMTRLLVSRAESVIAVEPDDRMRAELVVNVPRARAVSGRGESIPLPTGTAGAVVASASWHWMDPIPTLHEVARVLAPGGVLGAVWAGPDPEGALLVQAKELLARGSGDRSDTAGVGGGGLGEEEFSALIQGDGNRPDIGLTIPDGVPFAQPEHRRLTWEVALNADELIGLLGTFSWIIVLPEEARTRVFDEARRILRDLLGVEGAVTVDVGFAAEAWRARRHG
jgi:SAM-dependent methyltransferase